MVPAARAEMASADDSGSVAFQRTLSCSAFITQDGPPPVRVDRYLAGAPGRLRSSARCRRRQVSSDRMKERLCRSDPSAQRWLTVCRSGKFSTMT